MELLIPVAMVYDVVIRNRFEAPSRLGIASILTLKCDRDKMVYCNSPGYQ